MNDDISFILEGRYVSISPFVTESQEELDFRISKSLVSSNDPMLSGLKSVMKVKGCEYSGSKGKRHNIANTHIIRDVLQDKYLRGDLIEYIQEYVPITTQKVYVTIGRTYSDKVVMDRIAALSKGKIDSILKGSRISLINNTLSTVPHIPVLSYSDIGKSKFLDYTYVDIDSINIPVQIITSFNQLPYVENIHSTLKYVYDSLQPGGLFIVSDYDYKSKYTVQIEDNDIKQDNSLSMYMDAIYLLNMSINRKHITSFYSKYIPKFELVNMIVSLGFEHISSTKPEGLMREYTSIYRKKGYNNLVLEYKISTDTKISYYFPHIIRSNVSMDATGLIVKGVNYDDESISYSLPVRTLIYVSKHISTYGKKLHIIDATGLLGMNTIIFMNNKNVQGIDVYEPISKFYKFMINNVALYNDMDPSVKTTVPIKIKNISLYNSKFNHSSNVPHGSILYYDLHSISEQGMIDSVSLEMNTKNVFTNKNIAIVIYLLPSDHNLRVRHDTVTIDDKYSLFVVFPSYVREKAKAISEIATSSVNVITGGNPIHELMRYKIMTFIRDTFIARNSSSMVDYYKWLYEQMRIGILDPLIPAMNEFVPTIVSKSNVPSSYNDLKSFISTNSSILGDIPIRFKSVKPYNTGKIAEMRNEIITVMSKNSSDSTMKEIHKLILELYNTFESVKDTIGLSFNIKEEKGSTHIKYILEPNSTLLNTLKKFSSTTHIPIISITVDKYNYLTSKHKGISLKNDIVSMILRYLHFIDTTEGKKLHTSIPPSLYQYLSGIDINTECFSSPLNSYMKNYMSPYIDVDGTFSSMGSFFKHNFGPGNYEVHPPSISGIIDQMAKHVESVLEKANESNIPISFYIFVSENNNMLKESKYKRFDTFLSKGNHLYTNGDQYTNPGTHVSDTDTYVFILQSDMGTNTYPIPKDVEKSIKASFV